MKPLHPYNLSVFRARHGITQAEACRLLGLGLQSWRRYEKAGAVPLAWLHAVHGYAGAEVIHESV